MSRLGLVVTDLDGTFLDARGGVPPINREAVTACAAAGVPFVVATGRPSRWLDCLDGLPGVHPVVIVSNGAALYDLQADRFLEAAPLRSEVAQEVAAELRAAIPQISFAVEYGYQFGREPLSPLSADADGADWLTAAAPIEVLLTDPRPPLKLLACHHDYDSFSLAALARPIVADRLVVTHSFAGGLGLLEISAPGVTKGSALRRLAERLAISLDEVTAFGDMPNDVAMLDLVGRPCVMSSGHPAVLQRGYQVVGTNDEGGVGREVLRLLNCVGKPTERGCPGEHNGRKAQTEEQR